MIDNPFIKKSGGGGGITISGVITVENVDALPSEAEEGQIAIIEASEEESSE